MTRGNRPSYWRRRIWRHTGLALASAALTAGGFYLVHSPYTLVRLSMASAYAGLAFLSMALATGPWNLLRKRPNPVSTDVRRDIGIWAGILGLAHVVVGLQVHMGGNMWQYFFYPPAPRRLLARFDSFGLANYSGLAVAVILAVLLALSNDRSLRWLGVRRWKTVHRSAYVGFVLVVGHGALYQVMEKRTLPFVALFVALAVAVTALQLVGFRRVRLRAHRANASIPGTRADAVPPPTPDIARRHHRP